MFEYPKIKKVALLFAMLSLVAMGCKKTENSADAYGNFESRDVTVSAETPGRLLKFDVEEGMEIPEGKEIGLVDTTQLSLQIQELMARRRAAGSKTSNVVAQMDVVKEQVEVLTKEKNRVENLIQAGAATPKQLDDIKGQLEVLSQQKKSIAAQNLPVANEIEAIDANVERLRDQIRRCHLINPIAGRVTVKLSENTEVVAPGKPLYRIAPVEALYLRAYLSGSQLANVKIGQAVTVRIDDGDEAFHNYTGTITWIAEEAEFTPKIVQTKDERVNLVYAFKVKVPNDGRIKIGMPGEVIFSQASSPTAQTEATEK